MTIPNTARALRYSEFGDPMETLKLETIPLAPPEDDEVTVRILAAPVNPADFRSRQRELRNFGYASCSGWARGRWRNRFSRAECKEIPSRIPSNFFWRSRLVANLRQSVGIAHPSSARIPRQRTSRHVLDQPGNRLAYAQRFRGFAILGIGSSKMPPHPPSAVW